MVGGLLLNPQTTAEITDQILSDEGPDPKDDDARYLLTLLQGEDAIRALSDHGGFGAVVVAECGSLGSLYR